MVNKPSVFELLRFDCTSRGIKSVYKVKYEEAINLEIALVNNYATVKAPIKLCVYTKHSLLT